MAAFRARALVPLLIYVLSAAVYVGTAANRIERPTSDNHFVHLASSFLHGQVGVIDNRPVGTNDWACYDTELHDICGNEAWRSPSPSQHWYISFPPFPAVVLMPVVAIFGADTRDALFWALFAGLSPTFLYVLLRHLRERGISPRTELDDRLLTVLYAFGTVFYFVAVQGAVWFAAHVVGSVLLPLYLLFVIEARRPFLAGLVLAALFMTRPSTMYLGVIWIVEVLRMHRVANEVRGEGDGLRRYLAGVDWRGAIRASLSFGLPILAVGLVAMAMNQARFERPTEFGHRFLMIYWRGRIERWGLFSYHYLSKNLAVFLASLPWLTAREPHVIVSRHGLALWFTTPALLLALYPKQLTTLSRGLYLGAFLVCLMNLLYQNSGWIQFGYRFACDYLAVVFVLIALSGRKIAGVGFVTAMLFAIVVNTFGAITFDRAWQFYDDDNSQDRVFQPD